MTSATDQRAARVEVDRVSESYAVIWLDNGLLRIGCVPSLGGRVLSVQVRGA